MTGILLDTHAWAWSLSDGSKLSKQAKAAIKRAALVLVSPVSVFEIAQKVRLGKWPQMQALVGRLDQVIEEQGAFAADMSPEICLAAGMLDWAHRDPFDRLILSTALMMNVPLVSADPVFDGRVERVW